MSTKELKAELKQIRKEMKELGIKRTSCMNGGLDNRSYHYNVECFRLETAIKHGVSLSQV